jgi:hypothetical protein
MSFSVRIVPRATIAPMMPVATLRQTKRGGCAFIDGLSNRRPINLKNTTFHFHLAA